MINLKELKVDYNTIKVQRDRLEKLRLRYNELCERMKKDTSLLRDVWYAKTVDTVMETFENLYHYLDDINIDLKNDVKFLDVDVLQTFSNVDANIGKQVDDHLEV